MNPANSAYSVRGSHNPNIRGERVPTSCWPTFVTFVLGSFIEPVAHDVLLAVIRMPDMDTAPAEEETAVPQRAPNWIPFNDNPLATTRKLRVICVGAGFSGLTLAYKIQHQYHLENIIDFVIYEKNSDIGGTWLENRYPGCRCDVPSHIYSFLFAPNPDWSHFYSSATEIWHYIKNVADRYDLAKYVHLKTRLIKALWNEEKARWTLELVSNGRKITDECDIFINGSGVLNNWTWPQIEGLLDYQGHLTHSADWRDFDATDKVVAVIGNGSSGIQILPQLYKIAKHVTTFIRTPTYITAARKGSTALGSTDNAEFSAEQRDEFRNFPESLLRLRKTIQTEFNRGFRGMIRDSDIHQKNQKINLDAMIEKLSSNPKLMEKLIPDYIYGCRRATPGEGYLEALLDTDRTTVVSSPMQRITKDTIICESGEEFKVDAIVCATGFDVSSRPRWTHLGRNGRDLAKEWAVRPKGYLSLCATGYPNYFTMLGPNAPVGHGSLVAVIDWSADYILRWCQKIAQEDIRTVDVSQEATDDWNIYAQEFLRRTTWAGGCRSWYKNHQVGDEITALYPGSILHFQQMTVTLRPEDFHITYRSPNRYKYTGNGFTKLETEGEQDVAWYLGEPRTQL